MKKMKFFLKKSLVIKKKVVFLHQKIKRKRT